MIPETIQFLSGILAGIISGLLGVGGGIVIVPVLVALNETPLHSVATSCLAILIISISGSYENWRSGNFKWKKIISLGIPAAITSQIGVVAASSLPPKVLLILFGVLLFINVYLISLHRKIKEGKEFTSNMSESSARIITGGLAGFLSGLFGVGGGVIMVPLQVILLKEDIKTAIQTSLGVIVITALSATIGHSLAGNVLYKTGILVGVGGAIGAQMGTRFLKKLPGKQTAILFALLMIVIIISIVWKVIK
jgi:uncharacterized protein